MFDQDELELLVHLVSVFIMQTSQQLLERKFRGEDITVCERMLARARELNQKLRLLKPN